MTATDAQGDTASISSRIWKRNRLRKKLDQLLACAEIEGFMELVWSVQALQAGLATEVARYMRYPKEAVPDGPTHRSAIHKWELETLITLRLLHGRAASIGSRKLDTRSFQAMATIVHLLRSFENEDAAIYTRLRPSIFLELHRIGQRQFPWQRGYINIAQFYRYSYIYGRGDCADFFRDQYGLTIDEFSSIAFLLFSSLANSPVLARAGLRLEEIDISESMIDRALPMLSLNLGQAIAAAAASVERSRSSEGIHLPAAYWQSFLRRTPIIAFGDRLRAPLPELVVARATSGLYFDIVQGPAGLRNDASRRFESYAIDLLRKLVPKFDTRPSTKYRIGRKEFDGPDITSAKKDGQPDLIIECKATKLSYAAQFGDDPIVEAARQYDEIAKGVFQLWRFCAHVRRGLVEPCKSLVSARLIVLTLDDWLMVSTELQKRILARAQELASVDPIILAEDQRPIVFCTIVDFERSLLTSDADGFLTVLERATEPEFFGWQLSILLEHLGLTQPERERFPFELEDVLPWWGRMDRFMATRRIRA